MRHDSGAVEFNAVLLLFFIAALITGGALFAAAGMTYRRADTRDFERKAAADALLDTIVTEMQPLRLYPYDDRNNSLIESICQQYTDYALAVSDISSGYHLDFLSDDDMADPNIARLLFRDETGAAFVRWRDANGLSVSTNAWREFIKDEMRESCVSYGWLHTGDVKSFAYRAISKSFAITDPNKLFPLVNKFPRINVNMVQEPEMLRPFIMRESFKIEKPKEKADALIARLRQSPITAADTASILRIPASHPLMGYFGSRTSFWKITFTIRPSLAVEAIVAAIPRKNGEPEEIEEYRLVDRSFIDD